LATLGGIWTEAQAQEKLDWNIRQWEQNGHGQWLFFMKDSGHFVGRCGIRKMVVNAKEEVELGYSVMPELWGQGFATEMGTTAVQVAFEQFGYPSVAAFSLTDNAPSERVMHKLGFSFEAHIVHDGHPHVLYRLWNPKISQQVTQRERQTFRKVSVGQQVSKRHHC
jgi:RimJ/RimL family protein N-acetyltransferase